MNKIGIVIQQTDTFGEMKGRRMEGKKTESRDGGREGGNGEVGDIVVSDKVDV